MVNRPRQNSFQLEYMKQGSSQEGYWFLDQTPRAVKIGGKICQVAFRKYFPDTGTVGVVIDGKEQKRNANEFKDTVSFTPKASEAKKAPKEKVAEKRADAQRGTIRGFLTNFMNRTKKEG
ncbi:MAG: hypothetical protein ABL890_02770 [Candidatus Peribacteraceae bacterium]